MGFNEMAWVLNFLAVPLWVIMWWSLGGFRSSKSTPWLWLPFILAILYLLVNGGLGLTYTGVGDTAYEESRFGFIDSRARLGIDAAAAAVIVATIVYGLTIKRLPKAFLRFVIAAFVALLGITAPILWVPIELPELFFLLRHIQTIAMNFALFWIVAALIVMLRDMFEHSELIVKGKGHDGAEFSSEKKTSDRAG
jgi:hypothetical protein